MPSIVRIPRWCTSLALALLGAAAFFHLDADFPNHSRWVDDAARFTDEGWWASGAFHHLLNGHWLVPGDYNPGLSLPLWTAVLAVLFHFTGIQVQVARGFAFLCTIGTVLLCGRLLKSRGGNDDAALMLLVGTSPVLYYFSRMALLEPMLIFFLLASAVAAYATHPPGLPRLLVCGLCFTCAMFDKTTAIFVAPAIGYLLWFPHRDLWRSRLPADRDLRIRAIRAIVVPCLTVIMLYGLYWALVLRKYPVEVHTFYATTKPYLGWRSLEKAVRLVYRCFTWVDAILFPVAALAVLLSIRRLPALWKDPLFGFAVLFFCGYSAFMVLHLDAEPHYFPVLVVPVMLLAVLLLESLRSHMPWASTALGAVLLLAVVLNAGYIVRKLVHPEYTFRDACLQVRERIYADRAKDSSGFGAGGRPLVIGHGAMETTYFTRIPALDDLGVETPLEKIDRYHPGWLVGWVGEFGTDPAPELVQHYNFVEEGKYRVFDQAGRDYLMLYRIQPR